MVRIWVEGFFHSKPPSTRSVNMEVSQNSATSKSSIYPKKDFSILMVFIIHCNHSLSPTYDFYSKFHLSKVVYHLNPCINGIFPWFSILNPFRNGVHSKPSMASMASQQLHILHIDLQEIRGQDRRHDPRASAGRGDQAQISGAPVLMWIAPKKN